MILYFSGTGNSEYVAKRIGNAVGDEVLNLFDKIRNRDHGELHSEHPWVLAVPTYAWRIPRIVENWLKQTKLSGNRNIYFVMTCGDSIGNAGKYLEELCSRMGMAYRGCMEVVMPENYIAMFTAPKKEEALKIIEKAEPVIGKAAVCIRENVPFPKHATGLGGRLSSGLVNDIFYPMFVHAKKFHVTNACVSCGKCGQVCPLSNIRFENGKPVWGDECTHCMACICRCPAEAIEYGRRSKGQVRYTCPRS